MFCLFRHKLTPKGVVLGIADETHCVKKHCQYHEDKIKWPRE